MKATRVLVLGGYGLIGAAITRRLLAAGYVVTGFGRSLEAGRRTAPGAEWIRGDLARMTRPADWTPALEGVDVVVNAAGALQDGPRDDLGRSQRDAVIALIEAAETAGVSRFVQISAPGVEVGASTAFYRTKAAADARLAASRLRWTILRPGLVLGADSYGGSRLLRMIAAVPVVQPLALAEAEVRAVALDDVAEAALTAIRAGVDGDFDLVEENPHSLGELVAAVRRWLGFAPARATLRAPRWATALVGFGADALGRLGWRSPLRSTALRVLAEGVDGDPAPWRAATGMRLRSAEEALAARPATYQDRVAARASLAFPFLLATLSLFWIASGVIGAWRAEAATAVLAGALPETAALAAVWGGAAADILIGAALLVRRRLRAALLASIAVAVGYLLGGALLTPWLWADPLGPMVKVFPAIALAVALLALEQER